MANREALYSARMLLFALILLAAAMLPVAVDTLWGAIMLARLPRPRRGDSRQGLVIFVESIRWLNIRWGMRSTAEGLRRGGFRGEFRYHRWHETWRGLLVLPAIMDSAMLERRAAALAERIVRQRRRHPRRPLHVIGYSCGGYVAVRALELLPEDIHVDSAALIAAAVNPWRDLAPAARHVAGRLVVSSSVLDWLIVGVGTLVFGTGDRRHTFSLGMLGARRRPLPANGTDLRWRPGFARMGNLGGHFCATAAPFIRKRLAPELLKRT